MAYNVAAFADPFTTSYRFQDPQFTASGGALLGVFAVPRLDVLLTVLLSPYRGLFFGAPVLLLGVYGLAVWARDPRLRVEAALMTGIVLLFLAFNGSFHGWHGGWAVGPRYLVPAVPFLAVAAAVGFVRVPRLAAGLAAVSTALALLVTAVDAQAPAGNDPFAMIPGLPAWRHDPITDYEWPLFAHGRAWPILDAQREAVVRVVDGSLAARGVPPAERARATADLRSRIDEDLRAGRPAPLLLGADAGGQPRVQPSELSTFTGPVSVNPIGVYEGWMYRLHGPGSRQARWNSFNAGELLWEGSRWSLAPLLAIAGTLVALALRRAARLDRSRPLAPGPEAG